jgi:hypothetical protein
MRAAVCWAVCRQVGTFRTPLKDGWGITTIGNQMVLSDGSPTLTWVDPTQGFKAVRTVTVKDGTRSIRNLNEVSRQPLTHDESVTARVVLRRLDPCHQSGAKWPHPAQGSDDAE